MIDPRLEHVSFWAGWSLFILAAAAYARLWSNTSSRYVRRMEEALEEGVKQLEDKGEYIEWLEQDRAELRRMNHDLDIANNRLEVRAIDLENDRKKLMRALDNARLANDLLVKAMGEASQKQLFAERKMESMETRLVQLEAQLGLL